ncbi:MAG: sigma-70 family RNA polymerase sigma factor [Gammaproteobacteria bacterium]|nr:sigma-70 family RNA polymerase sigma factor [Gammaproteobacteria bacterium]
MTYMTASMDPFNLSQISEPHGRNRPAVEQRKAEVVEEASAESNEALLVAVGLDQDSVSFQKLFERFSRKIFALGMKLTRNEQLANDLVQEAMLKVWQKAPLYDLDRGTAQSWIFTLARNRCFDMLRKQKRQPQTVVNSDDIWPNEADFEPGFVNEEEGTQAVEIAQVERFYDDLPVAQKEVIEQIYIHDLTHEEAAAVLRIPLGTLKSRLRLGLSKLRILIGVN